MNDPPHHLTDEENALFSTYAKADELAGAAASVRALGYSPSDALDAAVNTLMTEFWDRGFSQTEIRNAFAAAMDDMNRYAGGQERR
jgi:hypothetical protein